MIRLHLVPLTRVHLSATWGYKEISINVAFSEVLSAGKRGILKDPLTHITR